MAKRAREQAVKEKRERKQAKKAEAAALRAAGQQAAPGGPAENDLQLQEPAATETSTRLEEPRALRP
jgi:hypothetical protein